MSLWLARVVLLELRLIVFEVPAFDDVAVLRHDTIQRSRFDEAHFLADYRI
jgi:hypothetical protein